MQDGEGEIPIYFWVKRSKVMVTTELCQHFGSDTITWVIYNVQLNRWRMVREMYLYILRSGGHSLRSSPNKVTALVTDPQRGPFWLCQCSSIKWCNVHYNCYGHNYIFFVYFFSLGLFASGDTSAGVSLHHIITVCAVSILTVGEPNKYNHWWGFITWM